MKRKIFKLAVIISLVAFPVINVFSDPPLDAPPPGPGGSPGGGGIPVGAPIDDGMGILVLLGVGYSSKKVYDLLRKKPRQTNSEVI